VSLPTVDHLRAHLNMEGDTSHDAELTDMLDAAVEVVEGIVGPVAEGTVTETHYGVSSPVLVLRRFPASSVTAVSSRVGAVTTPLTLVDFELDAASGIVRRADGGGFYGNYTVTYSTGRATVPASIHLAILIIAAHLFETQRMPGQSMESAPAGFGGADGIPDAGSTGMGYAIPRRAQELLQPYMLPVIA
jgi:hypothetical protein